MSTIAAVLEKRARWCVVEGDCLDVLRDVPSNCIDALVTDPPAGVSFMNRKWDSDKGGRDAWVAWLEERMKEAFRVMKPGAHGLVWALPRTSHWTAWALENAGFDIRDKQFHIFGSGFPKSLNVGKSIDKLAGAEREVIGQSKRHSPGSSTAYPKVPGAKCPEDYDRKTPQTAKPPITAPATDAAKQWDGWGTALKPAVEEWILIRKPVESSIVKNVLKHGTGGLNIEACRVPHASAADLAQHTAGVNAIKARGGSMDNSWKNSSDLSGASDVTEAGRWPSHLILSHAEGCERVGDKKVKAGPAWDRQTNWAGGSSVFTGTTTSPVSHADDDGTETVDDWECVDGCPVKELDEQSGTRTADPIGRTRNTNTIGYNGGTTDCERPSGYGDEGSASRYFMTFGPPFIYAPKASRDDREQGCEHLPSKSAGELTGRQDGTAGLESPRAGAGRTSKGKNKRKNDHPTVKSEKLMRYLVRLITPPGGVVIDLFAGSGSTGKACSAEGFRFIGIELEKTSVVIAKARIVGDAPLFNSADAQ